MSRNIKSNLKNPPAKLLLKTTYNPHFNTRNDYYLSPYNMKNNSNITTDYLSFYTHESINKSNKKIGNDKINYFYKNYRLNSVNKEKERYIQTQTQSKQMSRNNSNKNDLLFNKSNFKNSFSISKTNCNSLMISKKISKEKKMNNKIYKLLLKETENNNNSLQKSNSKIKKSNKFSKNKSTNNIHLSRKTNLLNTQNAIYNNIKTKTNKINKNNIKNMHITKYNFNHKNSFEQNFNNSNNNSKNKNKNLTLNQIDKNNHIKLNNKILFANIIKTNNHKNIKKINTNSFHKTCINTPMESYRKRNQIILLTQEIENKKNEIDNLKKLVNEKDIYIQNLEEKISSLNVTQNVDKEYDKYSKIIIVKNIKNLTMENEQLHKQIQEHKNKENKMMKLIQNMKKSGIDFDNILNKLNSSERINININSKNSNNNESINSNKYDDIVLKTDTTNNTNITNNTFLPLNLNEEQKNISYKSCINLAQNLPELPLKNINDYFNENYFTKNANDNIQIQIIDNNDCNILQK